LQHGTNKHGLKMMLWTTLAGGGATKILACSLMLEESTESCAWSSQCFLDCFRVAPAVIFSDSAPQLKAAVASVFPLSLHLYCIWHLSKNLVTNLKPACGADDGLWQRVCSTWWKIAKQSDVSSCATFDSDMASLGALLDESTVSSTSKSMVTARAWLAKLAEEREHWAYRFTWRTCTLGVHSTQRIEAVHAAIAHFLRASTLLTNLLPQLEAYSLNVTDRSSVRDFRFAQRLLAAADACLAHPLLTAVAPSVTAYALLLLKVQLQQASFYSAAPMLGQEGTFSVTRRPGTWGVAGSAEEQSGDADLGIAAEIYSVPRLTTLRSCSCQFPTCYGLPCRHMLQLYTLQQAALPLDLFDARWKRMSDAAVLAAEQALLQRRPARAAALPLALPDRQERHGLILAAARAVAEAGSGSQASYQFCVDSLATLLSKLRSPGGVPGARSAAAVRRLRKLPAPAAAGAPAAAAAAAPAADGDADVLAGPLCNSCWQRGHYKSNRLCPNFGKAALEKPRAFGRAKRVRRGPLFDTSSDKAEESDEEDGNDNVCHGCGQPGELFECDTCSRSWHGECLSEAINQLATTVIDYRTLTIGGYDRVPTIVGGSILPDGDELKGQLWRSLQEVGSLRC